MDKEYKRRKEVIKQKMTDYDRWTDPLQYEGDWSRRSEASLKFLNGPGWYCDIGCGQQKLRKILPEGSIYLPCDIKKWTSDTMLCEINQNKIPKKYLLMSDAAFMLGVIEYIYNPLDFFKKIAFFANKIIFSYSCLGMINLDRESMGWVNHFTLEEILKIINESGFKVEQYEKFETSQFLFCISNKKSNYFKFLKPILRRNHLNKIKNPALDI